MAKPKFRPRSGTDDLANFVSIVLHNEYNLPERIDPGAVVVDVGAHVGSFVVAAYARGARNIWAFEAEARNFMALEDNVRDLGHQVRAFNLAVWRSDHWGAARLQYVPSEVVERTGGGHVFGGEGGAQEVQTIPFDAVLEMASCSKSWGRVNLVKMDCEGSEWPILLTSKNLDVVDSIIGEFHEIGGPNMDKITTQQSHPRTIPAIAKVDGHDAYTADVLGTFLSGCGFTVDIVPTPGHEWIGKFWARRERNLWSS